MKKTTIMFLVRVARVGFVLLFLMATAMAQPRTRIPAQTQTQIQTQPQTTKASLTDGALTSGGIERCYKLYQPADLPGGAPLVVVLHGYGGDNDPERFKLSSSADRHGFAVCYPLGEKNGRGKRGWKVGYPVQADMTTDDVAFVEDLVRHLVAKHRFSPHNLFCTGMSNGGDMCYQLAAQRPRLFAAVAPVAGLMLDWLYRSDTCRVAVPLFEIHGTADTTSEWGGDPQNKGGWGAYPAVPLAVGFWAAKNRCTTVRIDTLGQMVPGGHRVISHRFTGGVEGSEVWLHEIEGGKHSWGLRDIDTGEEIWRFFSRFVN